MIALIASDIICSVFVEAYRDMYVLIAQLKGYKWKYQYTYISNNKPDLFLKELLFLF